MNNNIQMMERHPVFDAKDLDHRQRLAEQMLMNSLTPKKPEKSWTQGLARMVGAGLAGYEKGQIGQQKEQYQNQKKEDMQKLGMMLAGQNPQDIFSQLQTDEAQGLGLGLAQNYLTRQEAAQARKDAMEQNRLNQENKFQQQKELALFKQSLRPAPIARERNLQREFANQAYEALAAGQELNPAQKMALENSRMGGAPEETAYRKKLNEGYAASDLEKLNMAEQEARASGDIKTKGNQILHILARNPRVNGGFGQEEMVKMKGFLSNFLPEGSLGDLGDQQALQKAVGQMTPEAAGVLMSKGINRITQGEVLHVIPTITVTMNNTRDGMKKIIELNNALDVPIQKANKAISEIKALSRQNPSLDLGSAINKIEEVKKQQMEAASMAYGNSLLRAKGQQLIVNPEYDPETNPVNKYMVVPIQQ